MTSAVINITKEIYVLIILMLMSDMNDLVDIMYLGRHGGHFIAPHPFVPLFPSAMNNQFRKIVHRSLHE